MTRRLHLELDQTASAVAKRQAGDLHRRYHPAPIPAEMRRAAELGFLRGAERALGDEGVGGDLAATLGRLHKHYRATFEAALHRLSGRALH